jgi:hypothetical protein
MNECMHLLGGNARFARDEATVDLARPALRTRAARGEAGWA